MSRRVGGPAVTLSEGVYEHLVTEELARHLEAATGIARLIEPLDDADAQATFARHVGSVVARALSGLPAAGADELIRKVLDHLAGLLGEDLAELVRDQRLQPPPSRLMAVSSRRGSRSADVAARHVDAAHPSAPRPDARPRAGPRDRDGRRDRHDRRVHHGGRRARDPRGARTSSRVAPAPRLRAPDDDVHRHDRGRARSTRSRAPRRRGPHLVRHATHAASREGWLFHRNTGLHTAYVGSANLTATALGAATNGWSRSAPPTCRTSSRSSAARSTRSGTTPSSSRTSPRRRALSARASQPRSRAETATAPTTSFLVTLQPFPFQQEILDRLAAERARPRPTPQPRRRRDRHRQDRHRGVRLPAPACERTGVAPRLLFLAHRREILEQAAGRSATCCSDASFGELSSTGEEPARWDHVFATIQSAAAKLVERLGAGPLPLRRRRRVPPRPRRSRTRAVVPTSAARDPRRPHGDARSAPTASRSCPTSTGTSRAELRLWHALDGQLLVPFEYYGLADGDRPRARCAGRGRATTQATSSTLYTGNEARVDLDPPAARDGASSTRARSARSRSASRVEHAEFMARALTAAGIPRSRSHGDSPASPRARARDACASARSTCSARAISTTRASTCRSSTRCCSCAPRTSATLFLQQLGRGLRTHRRTRRRAWSSTSSASTAPSSASTRSLAALTGIPRARLRKARRRRLPVICRAAACSSSTRSRATRSSLAARRPSRVRSASPPSSASSRPPTRATPHARAVPRGDRPRPRGRLRRRRMDHAAARGRHRRRSRRRGPRRDRGSEPPPRLAPAHRRAHAPRAYRERPRAQRSPAAARSTDYARRRMHDARVPAQSSRRAPGRRATSPSYLAARPTIVRELDELADVLEERIGARWQDAIRSRSGRSRCIATTRAARSSPRSAS